MYELLFWKYLDEVYLNHQEVYEALDVEPTVLTRGTTCSSDFKQDRKCFFKWEKVDDSSWKTVMDWRFHATTSSKYTNRDCYGTQGKQWTHW
jgi:hypothetical protein